MKNILISGVTGSGKTLLIKRLADIFKEFNPQGFLTLELKEEGAITGLAVISLSGESKVLSQPEKTSKRQTGKLSFDIKAFEAFLTHAFPKDKKAGIYFIDEIGKIECQSKKFCKLINELLKSENPLIASIGGKGSSFIQEIRKRDDVRIVEITPGNRDLLLKGLTMELRDILLD